MYVELYQGRIANCLEAVDLARLDYKDVSSAALEGLAVDCPNTAAFANELDFVIGMAMRTRSGPRLPMEQEHRNTGVTLLRPDKLMRTTNKRKVLLPYVVHVVILLEDWMNLAAVRLRNLLFRKRELEQNHDGSKIRAPALAKNGRTGHPLSGMVEENEIIDSAVPRESTRIESTMNISNPKYCGAFTFLFFFLLIGMVAGGDRRSDNNGKIIVIVTFGDIDNTPADHVNVQVHGYGFNYSPQESILLKASKDGQYEASLQPALYDVFVSESGSEPRCRRLEVKAGRTTYWTLKLEIDDAHLIRD
jgi:hypothetical protein